MVKTPGLALGPGLRATGPSWVASQRLWGARRPGSLSGALGAGRGSGVLRATQDSRAPASGREHGASGRSLSAAPGPDRPGLARSLAPLVRRGQAELIALGAAAAWGAPVESAAGTLSARQAAAALGQSRLGPRGGQEGRGRRNLRRCAGVRGRARPEGTECDDKVTGWEVTLWQDPGRLTAWRRESWLKGTRLRSRRTDRTVWHTRWGGLGLRGRDLTDKVAGSELRGHELRSHTLTGLCDWQTA